MNTVYHTTFSSPFGAFSLAVDARGSVVATAFGDLADLKKRYRTGAFAPSETRTAKARRQVRAVLEGRAKSFRLPLAAAGTPFQLKVWRALTAIPRGQTRTYGEIAKAIGRTTASRAVGRANATNPICLIVPCHRVIGADGSLTGFAFGETLKRRLLALEGANRSR